MKLKRTNQPMPVAAIWVCCSLASLAAMHNAYAIWDFVPESLMAIETNDNPRLNQSTVQQNTVDSTRTLVDAHIGVSNVGQRGEVYVEPRVRIDAYGETENQDLESEDLFLRATGEYRWQAVSDERMQDTAKDLGVKIREEDGVRKAVEIIDRLLARKPSD